MTPSREPNKIKQFSIRWPEDFWEAVSIAAIRGRTSIQQIVTKAVAKDLNIPTPTTGDEEAAA